MDGRAYVESPRWHDGRLWFAHWGTGEIVAVDTDGQSEVVGHGPPTVSAAVPGHSLGWSIDWLPDGRLLITSKELARREPAGWPPRPYVGSSRSHFGTRLGMRKQIAVRLPDDLVASVDEVVAIGRGRSRAAVVTRARPIHRARLDKSRPVLILTRDLVRPHMHTVTVAPIPTTIRGLSTEIAVGPANGLGDRCVVACDHVTTIRVTALGRQVGLLLDEQAANPTNAIHAAFDLD